MILDRRAPRGATRGGDHGRAHRLLPRWTRRLHIRHAHVTAVGRGVWRWHSTPSSAALRSGRYGSIRRDLPVAAAPRGTLIGPFNTFHFLSAALLAYAIGIRPSTA